MSDASFMMRRLIPAFIAFPFALQLFGCATTSYDRMPKWDPDAESALKQLAVWETEGNAVATRSSQAIQIEHFEIPLRLLEKDFSKRVDPETFNSIVFKRDGEEFVRWIINPEDTKWHLEVAKWLESKGVSSRRHKHFRAYMTASRSYLIEDPTTGASFSAKVSTNVTGGNWKDKKLDLGDSREVRLMSEYIEDVADRVHFRRLRFLPEPMLMGIEDIDQAMLVRSLEPMKNGETLLLPLFSALHENVGREIALRNGSHDPAAFWEKNLAIPLAEAYAELAAHFGFTYDSPHGQNFMIELDRNYRPTGRMYFKDFADAYLTRPHFQATGATQVLDGFYQNNVTNELRVAIGLLHGNKPPSWIDVQRYHQMNVSFYKSFERVFSKITGIPAEELTDVYYGGSNFSTSTDFGYYNKSYSTKSESWKNFLAKAPCAQGKAPRHKCLQEMASKLRIHPDHLPDPMACEAILQNILVRNVPGT